MTKQEVMEALCALVSEVGWKKFNEMIPHDCFCGLTPVSDETYNCHSDVINYIVDTVGESL